MKHELDPLRGRVSTSAVLQDRVEAAPLFTNINNKVSSIHSLCFLDFDRCAAHESIGVHLANECPDGNVQSVPK